MMAASALAVSSMAGPPVSTVCTATTCLPAPAIRPAMSCSNQVQAQRHERRCAVVDHEIGILDDHPFDDLVDNIDIDPVAVEQLDVAGAERPDRVEGAVHRVSIQADHGAAFS